MFKRHWFTRGKIKYTKEIYLSDCYIALNVLCDCPWNTNTSTMCYNQSETGSNTTKLQHNK